MNDEQIKRSYSSSDTQNKMSDFLKKKSNQLQNTLNQPEKESQSNIYNFSEVSERNEEEPADDLAIVSFIERGAENNTPGMKSSKPIPKGAKPLRSSQGSKRPVSVKRPHQFNKLNESEKEGVFLTVYDENLKLKENQQRLEQYYSQLDVKFKNMERHMKDMKYTDGKEPVQKVKPRQEEKDEEQQYLTSQLQQENLKLKQKLSALSQAQKIVSNNKPQKRKLYTSDKVSVEPEKKMSIGRANDNEVKDLLKLNEMLKKRCLEQESQVRSMQAMMNSKINANKDLSDKNTQFVTLKERYEKMEMHLQAQRNQLEDERKRQSEILALLRDEREKNHSLEQQVRSMELMAKSAKDLSDDLQECKKQKQELEERLKILMESPFFKDYNERATVQAKLRTMENEQARNAQELKGLRDANIRLETENQIRRQELTDATTELRKRQEECKEYQMQLSERDKQLAPFKDLNYWDNDQFLKVLGNLKWTGEDPAWRKIEFIDRTYLDSDDPNVLRKEIEHLKLEKGELAAHLEKTQTLLKTRQDIELEKDKIHKTEMDKIALQLRAALSKCTELAKIADLHSQIKQQRTIFEAEGIKYDDSVSVFSVDPVEDDQLSAGENYFDFWVGQAELDAAGVQNALQQAAPRSNVDIQTLLTFLTVDFYDHETQHTSVAEGTHCQFNLQVCFKVNSDVSFIQYLDSGYLKLELYMSQGSEAIKLATGLLSLRELVIKNTTENVSKVLTGHITFNGYNNQFIGIVYYKCRMRQPIGQIIRWLKDQKELDIQEQEEMADIIAVRRRKVVIVIDKASQLPQKSNSFIYYSLDNKDYNTNTQPGSNPRWDFRMVHEIVYNEEFVTILKKQPLEFYLIDDNQPFSQEGSADKLGMAVVDLAALLTGDIIDIAAQIKNDDDEKVGSLYVKIFWYESGRDDEALPMGDNSLIQASWEESVTQKIAAQARSRGLSSLQTFRIMDFDNDQVISIDDFQNGLRNVFGIKLNNQEFQLYYSKLPQPLNQLNFDQVFRQQIGGNEQPSFMMSQPVEGLSRINLDLKFNTQQLQLQDEKIDIIKRSINEVIQNKLKKGKTKSDLFNEIDSVRPDGYITVSELQGWLRFSGLNIGEEDVQLFLQSYMDQDHDNRVNVKEFFNYILGGLETKPSIQSQGSFQSSNRQRQKSDSANPILMVLDSILKYAQANEYTLMKVRQIMDVNKNGFVDRQEMSRFLLGCGIQLDNQELLKVFDFFDKNKDQNISVQEFADALNNQNKQKQINSQNPTFDGINMYIVGYLISYMKKQSRTMPQMFSDIDKNEDGYLSKDELINVFKKQIVVPLDKDEFETFFHHFDENKDGRISIKEFVQVIQPAIQRSEGYNAPFQLENTKTLTVNDRVYLTQLTKKAEDICTLHSRNIMSACEIKEDTRNPGFITPANFKNVLQSLSIGFTNSEIDKLISDICEQNGAGLINYIKFVELGRKKLVFEQTSNSLFGNLSMVDQEKGMLKAKEVFSRISRAIKRSKSQTTAKQIFRSFDVDGDDKITKQELGNALAQMKQKQSEEDLTLIFITLDNNGDGYIKINEFIKWLDL